MPQTKHKTIYADENRPTKSTPFRIRAPERRKLCGIFKEIHDFREFGFFFFRSQFSFTLKAFCKFRHNQKHFAKYDFSLNISRIITKFMTDSINDIRDKRYPHPN